MSLDMECYDLQHMVSDGEKVSSLMQRAVETGYRIPAYSGTYFNMYYRCLQIIAGRTSDGDMNGPARLSGHTHNVGSAFWRFRVVREVTPEGSTEMDMRVLAEPVNGGLLTAIDVMNADILPSYAPGEIIDLQMIAKTRKVCSYPDTEAFARAKDQQRIMEAAAAEDDELFYLSGMIPQRRTFTFELPTDYGRTTRKYVPHCRISTAFGEVQAMIREKEKAWIEPGRVLSALCTVQGDSLIGEYDAGMVISKKNNLMALRYALCSGRMKRLIPVLAENCSLYSEPDGQMIRGRENIIAYLDERYRKLIKQGTVYSLYGLAAETACEDKPGEYCVIAGQGEETEKNDAWVFHADHGEGDRIRFIRIDSGKQYRFRGRYRSWEEMETADLVRRGISPAMLRKQKTFANFLNRHEAHHVITEKICSLLDERVELEFGEQRYEGADRALAFLENLADAITPSVGFSAEPVLVSTDPTLETAMCICDVKKEQAVALISKLDEEYMPCFFLMHRDEATGKVDTIRHMKGRGYAYIQDYYEVWDPCRVAEGGQGE